MKIREFYIEADKFQSQQNVKITLQEEKIKRLESEISRNKSLISNKEKHSQRLLIFIDSIKLAATNLLDYLTNSSKTSIPNNIEDLIKQLRVSLNNWT